MAFQISARPSDYLSEDVLLDMYWTMLLSRRLDERAWVLHRQGKIAFHISGMGHEGVQVGTAFAINRGVDYVHPYYRDLALVLAIGITPTDFMMSLFGKAGEKKQSGAADAQPFWLPPAEYRQRFIACRYPGSAGRRISFWH